MGTNLAHRRAAKAARRKKLLAGRRAAKPASLAEKIRRLATAPLYCCLIQPDAGISSIFLAREIGICEMAVAVFLVDTFALGVKDVFFSAMPRSDFKEFLSIAEE